MPEHGAVKRKMGDKVYVYYATAVYRNAKGQPTSDRVSMGKYDPKSGMLIPNRSYYEVYLKQPVPCTTGVKAVGVGYAFEEICKKLGIIRTLKAYFPRTVEADADGGAVYVERRKCHVLHRRLYGRA